MNSKVSMMKSMVVAVALAAGVSGIARADDSSMSRFGGDSYAYFNNAVVDKAPSAWRQANPNGVPEQQLEALSSEALATFRRKNGFLKFATPAARHKTSRLLTRGGSRSVVAGEREALKPWPKRSDCARY